jgi:hypothetical protein
MLALSSFICITKTPEAQAASLTAARLDRSADCGGKGCSWRSPERKAQGFAKAADFRAQVPGDEQFPGWRRPR